MNKRQRKKARLSKQAANAMSNFKLTGSLTGRIGGGVSWATAQPQSVYDALKASALKEASTQELFDVLLDRVESSGRMYGLMFISPHNGPVGTMSLYTASQDTIITGTKDFTGKRKGTDGSIY